MGQQLLTMKMFVVLALAAAALAEPEADALTYTTSPLLRAFNNVNLYNTAAVQPITTTYNHVATPVVQSVATPFVQHVASPVVYAQPQVATHTITNYHNPEHYTAVSNGAVGPKCIAKNGPVQHIVKREAEAEADPLLLNTYSNIPAVSTYSYVAAVPQVYSPINKLYNTAAVQPFTTTYSNVATPLATSVVQHVATPVVQRVASPVVYAQPKVATHAITNYNNPTQYTAVSTSAYGPKYIAKNGPVQHIVKREAEADAEPLHLSTYSNIPAVSPYSHVAPVTTYNTVPQVFSAVNTPLVKSVVKPVVAKSVVPHVYNTAIPQVYNTAL